ncbi:MAG: PadR family transcriptional regulator [Candidatus Latescibacterota bacterium]|nr:MAG: PadR family transcriptional regulator [Candidatus Latescibacterota bacterium]
MSRFKQSAAPDPGRMATELESCVLAILAQSEPCTAYAVRRFLSASLSSYWSASAGAIYPLLRRLEARGWIRAQESRWGTRVRRAFKLTRAGRRHLREWLSPPLPTWAIAYTYDPVRTRVFFLEAAPPAQQRAFLDDAIAQTEAILLRHRSELNAPGVEFPPFEAIGRRGAIEELETRLRWLRAIRARLRRARGRGAL